MKNCLHCLQDFEVQYASQYPRRKFCSHKCYTNSRIGKPCPFVDVKREKNYFWRGGKYIDKLGYVLIKDRNHPYCDSKGYVREHRIVMEKKLNRYLLPSEVVHHKDENKLNNQIENLELMTASEHVSLHKKKQSAPARSQNVANGARSLARGIQS